MRKVIALFDEYQSKENAKHVIRSMKENARQGFWNGSMAPLGYRLVDAEKRGAKVKKKLDVDSVEAETVRLIFQLYLQGDGQSGALGVKEIVKWLNGRGYRTRRGMTFGVGSIHKLLTNTVYIGRWRFNQTSSKPRKRKPDEEIIEVPVPAIIDHNRVIIDVEVPARNGATQRVHAWVDNGNPDLLMSEKLVTATGLGGICGGQTCSATPPKQILIGGMEISFDGVKEAKVPIGGGENPPLAHGLDADITIPATILRHYDVLIDYPGRKFTIGAPGSIHFLGTSARVEINADNGLIQIPSKIANKKYNLALDLGSSISFLSADLFGTLSTAHSDWPHMTGAVGAASMLRRNCPMETPGTIFARRSPIS